MGLGSYLKNLSQIYNRPSGSVTATDAQTAIDQLNAGANLVGASTKATPVAGDGFVIVDSADSNKLKRVLYSTLSALFGYTPPAGTILQTLQTTKTDTFTTSSTSFTDITGLSVSITPSSSSNKILIIFDIKGLGNGYCGFKLLRDSTGIYIGGTASNRTPISSGGLYNSNTITTLTTGGCFLDSPSSTSAITYKIQGATESGTLCVNRSSEDGDYAFRCRPASSITVMEVKG